MIFEVDVKPEFYSTNRAVNDDGIATWESRRLGPRRFSIRAIEKDQSDWLMTSPSEE